MKVNYIVVGCGLAGIAFCEQLRQNKKSFLVFDDAVQLSSKVAGGIFNPVVLKRFSAAWKAKELLEMAIPFYKHVENNLRTSLIIEQRIRRIFVSAEEQNNWVIASDQPILSEFLIPRIVLNQNKNIKAEFGFGEVQGTGRIDTEILIDRYMNKLEDADKLIRNKLDPSELSITSDSVEYHGVEAENIIFADGFGLKGNIFFDYLPMLGSKGEYITIKSSGLKLDHIVKGPVFIIPLGNDEYLVGATYDNKDKTNAVTESAKEVLVINLKKMIRSEFELVDQVAAIRPTVKDRRPLIGRHPRHENLWILNGLGTRGVMASPYCASQLYNHIEKSEALDPEIDIKRFENLFFH